VRGEQAPKVMLMHAWNERLELHDLVTKVAETCRKLKVDTLVIESKASGISVAQELRRLYGSEDWSVMLNDPGSQDKLSRLYSVQHLFAEEMIHAPDRTWADMVISQVASFPHGKHDDIVDTVSQALRKMRDMGLLVRGQERLEEIEASKVYTGRAPAPLYPG
jgi:predicted phage terminase large subunit-like protein